MLCSPINRNDRDRCRAEKIVEISVDNLQKMVKQIESEFTDKQRINTDRISVKKFIQLAVRLDIDGAIWNQFWGVQAHIPMPTDPSTLDAGHGVVIVGYDKINYSNSPGGGRFILRNNWGNGWGDNGYGTIPFDYVKKYGVDDSSEKSLGTLKDEYCVSSRSPCYTVSAIGVACYNDRLCIFYPHSDDRIYMQTYDGEHWRGESCVSYDGKGLTKMEAIIQYY